MGRVLRADGRGERAVGGEDCGWAVDAGREVVSEGRVIGERGDQPPLRMGSEISLLLLLVSKTLHFITVHISLA